MAEGFQDVFQGVGLHVLAHAAAADEGLVRELILHAGIETAFGEEQERSAFGLVLDVGDHLAGAAYVIAEQGDTRMAFGVAHHLKTRILTAEEVNQFGIVGFVHVAATAVQHDFLLDAPLLHFVNEVLTHKAIGNEHDLVVFEAAYNLHHVRAGNANVAVCLHIGGGVDVADEGMIGILFTECTDFGAGDGVGQATAGQRARNQNVLGGVQNLCGFAHKTDGGEHDGLCVHLGGVLAQLKAVAIVVGYAQDDFRGNVAVGENDGVAFFLKLVDFVNEGEHLLAFFHGVGAKYSAGLDSFETIKKFFCSHGAKYRNKSVWTKGLLC